MKLYIKKWFSPKNLLLFATFSLYLLIGLYLTRNFSQSERFGDETAHIVGGHFVLKGKTLYKDLQFNHQPLNYLFPAVVEGATQPSNLYLYIARQRFGIFGYSLLWNILLILCFGPVMILFALIFEISKYWYSGYKVLAETLAAYPTVFLFASLIHIWTGKKKVTNWLLILVSISSFVAGFSLLPLWIVIGPINLILFFFYKDWKRFLLYQLCPGLILTAILFFFVPPQLLIQQTIFDNMNYFVPASAVFRPSIWQMIFFPFYVFSLPLTIQKLTVATLIISLLINGYFFWKEKKIRAWLVIFGLFILTNFFRVGDNHFDNFHLFPWFGVLLVTNLLFLSHRLKKEYMIVGFGIVFVILAVSQPYLWKKKDLMNDNYVQYSPSETYGRAIKVMKDADDNLIVAPNDPLIYWVADIDIPTRLLEFYPWIYPIPEYNAEVTEIFTKRPPEFFVNTGLDQTNKLEIFIYKNVQKKYIQVNHLGKPSKLYILKTKLKDITSEQRKELHDMLFDIP